MAEYSASLIAFEDDDDDARLCQSNAERVFCEGELPRRLGREKEGRERKEGGRRRFIHHTVGPGFGLGCEGRRSTCLQSLVSAQIITRELGKRHGEYGSERPREDGRQ